MGDLSTALTGSVALRSVCTPAEFAQRHIARAVNLPLGHVQARAGGVPGNQPV